MKFVIPAIIFGVIYILHFLGKLPIIILLDRFWLPGITIGPFIIIRKADYSKILLNHECIHQAQQLELLIIGAYIWYAIEFLIKLVKYRSPRLAYFNLSFEREAYVADRVMGYLSLRRNWEFVNYLTNSVKKTPTRFVHKHSKASK